MRNKSSKKVMKIHTGKVEKSFTEERITSHSGLAIIWDYIVTIGLPGVINRAFPTKETSAGRFTNVQILLSIVLANLSGVHRLLRMENFSKDPLVSHLLRLPGKIEDSTYKDRLLKLGKSGSFLLQSFLFIQTRKWISKCGLSRITIDCDSTVQTVYGKQEGSAIGFNPHKKGAASYHPLVCYYSEMKLLVNSWFRTGSAYTSNGICQFMSQTLWVLPKKIRQIFFRADSGFFNGALFDLLEQKGHEYLVKVKLKNLQGLLKKQSWTAPNNKVSICEFNYKAAEWKVARKLKAIRILTGFSCYEFMGEVYKVPIYEYFCYCSKLKGLDVKGLHILYGARAESENWIEQTKNQLHASQTVTDNFDVNDILWQLAVLGYNLSVMIRYEADHKEWRQEPVTFMRWFINVPAKVVHSARKVFVKMSVHYWEAPRWQAFALKVASSA